MAGVAIDTVLELDRIDRLRRMGGAAPNPPPPPHESYRYYHCREDWNDLHCKKVSGPSVMPTEDYTKLIAIKSYIPERLDKIVLKYKWIPDRVFIR